MRRLGTCKCAAWAQRSGCIFWIWTRRWNACSERPSSRRRRRPAPLCSRARKAWEASVARGCGTVCARADWHGFADGARAVAGARNGDSFPRGDGGAQQRNVDRPDPVVAGQRREFDSRGCAQHHREQLPRRDAIPVPRADESAHRSPCEEHVRMTLKPSSFGSEVGMFGLRRWPHCGGE